MIPLVSIAMRPAVASVISIPFQTIKRMLSPREYRAWSRILCVIADIEQRYFKDHNPPYPYYEGGKNIGKNGGLYNRVGRGYPDVAANGDNIAVYNAGEFDLSGGTSASRSSPSLTFTLEKPPVRLLTVAGTPIFGAIINRIIDERLAIGKGPVGFINPVLYKNPSVLNDITNGSNPGCGTDGFSTAPG
jgi:tripeptidyl-peptidase-1